MKKLFTMFLAVMLVVSLAGMVMADGEEVMGFGWTPPSACPPLVNFDTLKVNYSVVPQTGIEILTRDLTICTYIGCGPCNEASAKPISYKAIATGACLRKIVGRIQSALPTGISLDAKLNNPDSSGTSQGWKTLSTSDVDLVKGISKMCWANGTGEVRLGATNDACAASGIVVMQLTIMDQA